MRPIAIYGAGGFGREVRQLIEQINSRDVCWEFIGFFDNLEPISRKALEEPFLGGIKELNNWSTPLHTVIAIGDPQVKSRIVSSIDNPSVMYPVLVHPDVYIGTYQKGKIGEGSIITQGNCLTVNYSIGKHVILNVGCCIGHDSDIGDYASIMPAVNVSGNVIVGSKTFVGTGAKIVNGLTIGENSIIGAGAVVTTNIPPFCTAVGVPAQPIKFHH